MLAGWTPKRGRVWRGWARRLREREEGESKLWWWLVTGLNVVSGWGGGLIVSLDLYSLPAEKSRVFQSSLWGTLGACAANGWVDDPFDTFYPVV